MGHHTQTQRRSLGKGVRTQPCDLAGDSRRGCSFRMRWWLWLWLWLWMWLWFWLWL